MSRILLFIFVANFFYDDGGLFLFKRIIYSGFIYLAIYEMFQFYLHKSNDSALIKMPGYYRSYIALFFIFIGVNLVTDFLNPALNIVTLINNPYALMATAPVFLFYIGVQSPDLKKTFDLLMIISSIFLLTWVIKLPGKIPYFQGFISSMAILPFFIISNTEKKKRLFAVLLVLLAVAFSMVSGYRIVLLKTILFFSLFFSLNTLRNSGLMKLIIMLTAAFFVFLMLNNLEQILDIFKGLIGKTDFDADDTRSFLYKEFFGDFKSSELILGRGFMGTYFSNYFLQLQRNLDDTGDFYQRYGIEVGFLQLLLKGGFVYYILYVLPLWYVAIKSIFRYAHQKITFFIGIFIFTELLLMFFENIPYFSFQFSLLFFFAGYAYRTMVQESRIHQTITTKRNRVLSATVL